MSEINKYLLLGNEKHYPYLKLLVFIIRDISNYMKEAHAEITIYIYDVSKNIYLSHEICKFCFIFKLFDYFR